jgi:hypothetical protein
LPRCERCGHDADLDRSLAQRITEAVESAVAPMAARLAGLQADEKRRARELVELQLREQARDRALAMELDARD